MPPKRSPGAADFLSPPGVRFTIPFGIMADPRKALRTTATDPIEEGGETGGALNEDPSITVHNFTLVRDQADQLPFTRNDSG